MEQLQQENESNKKQLDRLSRDMTGFEQKHEKLLAEGQRLYESIAVDGGNTLTWTKDDFVHSPENLPHPLRHGHDRRGRDAHPRAHRKLRESQ